MQHFTNIFDKLIISVSWNNFLQLGCKAAPLIPGLDSAPKIKKSKVQNLDFLRSTKSINSLNTTLSNIFVQLGLNLSSTPQTFRTVQDIVGG